MTSVDAYVIQVARYGTEGVLEVAALDLTPDGYAELLRRLVKSPASDAAGFAVRCATPGCLVNFVPSRRGQTYHSPACRQMAHRFRAGSSSRFSGSG
jgi:hypothetical protein